MTLSRVMLARRSIAWALSLVVVMTFVPSVAWAHGQGVGLVLGGISGAIPAIVVGLAHAVLAAVRIEATRRGGLIGRVLAITAGAVVLSFVLHGLAERFTREAGWLLSVVIIDLGLCAIVAWPVVRALYDGGQKPLARAVMIGSLLTPVALVLLMLALLTRG